jgi:serine/threonine-protein kinase
MSNAQVCMDTNLDRLVIVKELHPGTNTRRILDELSALQAIRSKHVVQIYDVIRDNAGAVQAIVEEYLPGNDLTKLQAPATADKFLAILYPIAEGISDIHSHGLVHRDIKRQNMKYDEERCLKIFDFGLARDAAKGATTMGEIGTPGYMAPELFKSTPDGITTFTQAVDTFAFGATALAIVLGRLPLELRQTPPRLPSRRGDFKKLPFVLPAEVADVLCACMDPDPAFRPNMTEVAQTMASHLLRDRHRALIVYRGEHYDLNSSDRAVVLSVNGQGTITLRYDGLRFVVDAVGGDVAINNTKVSTGDILPGSCVIVLGHVSLGTNRTNITVDVSHPEVAI